MLALIGICALITARNLQADGVHINGIERFANAALRVWSFTKRRLAKFNGVKVNFDIHLKESEWRWGKDFDTMVKHLNKMIG